MEWANDISQLSKFHDSPNVTFVFTSKLRWIFSLFIFIYVLLQVSGTVYVIWYSGLLACYKFKFVFVFLIKYFYSLTAFFFLQAHKLKNRVTAFLAKENRSFRPLNYHSRNRIFESIFLQFKFLIIFFICVFVLFFVLRRCCLHKFLYDTAPICISKWW